jgi:hypothetical protein
MKSWMCNAKSRSLQWGLTLEQLDDLWARQKGRCALTGIRMSHTTNDPYKMSLDRIDNSRGYTPDNVQFVCACVNFMKNDSTEEEFVRLCRLVSSRRRRAVGASPTR